MKLNLELGQVTGVALTVASLLLAASCARDGREATRSIPQLDVGHTLSSTNNGAATSSPPRSRLTPSAAELSGATTALNPGWMTARVTAQTGIRADEIGSAPLTPLAIAFAEGSHADNSLVHEGGERAVPAGTLPDGAACNQNADCQSNSCRNWSSDGDADGFGAAGTVFRRCGPPGPGFAGNDDDCCDIDALVHPAQTAFQDGPSNCGGSSDFNCDGVTEFFPPALPCGALDEDSCGVVSFQPVCGVPGGGSACFLVDGVCQAVRGVQVTPSCL